MLIWLSNYPCLTHQQFIVPESTSSLEAMESGVLEGSILVPLLLFFNDIVGDIDVKINLFVDDTRLIVVADSFTSTTII